MYKPSHPTPVTNPAITQESTVPKGKVAASSVQNGEYYVGVVSVAQTPEVPCYHGACNLFQRGSGATIGPSGSAVRHNAAR